jgi:hypothetical protein
MQVGQVNSREPLIRETCSLPDHMGSFLRMNAGTRICPYELPGKTSGH